MTMLKSRKSVKESAKSSKNNGSTQLSEKTPPESEPMLRTAQSKSHISRLSSIQRSISGRQTWTNGIQFILTCTSYAVGLGNIWRFPAVVYKNGGGAFLIPYFCCSMIIGFPVLYLELCLGQFARAGPAVVYGRMKPAFQGIGWVMVTMSAVVTIFYNMVVAWSILYIYVIVSGQSYDLWSSCRHSYNTISEYRTELYKNWSAMSPAEEFYENYILEKSPELGAFGMNWKLLGSYSVAWLLTAAALSKGTKIIGYLSYATATLPYLIMLILFGRAVFLDGAYEGMKYYILEPDLSVVYNPNAWREAATQVCFSLSVGFGGILSFSSFNPSTQNVFRDALIVTIADATMSIVGGTAVFSVLGFMSKEMNVSIGEVVQDGTALAFVAYPEALIRMPVEPLWSILFFLMVFLLGISSQFGYAEAAITAFVDQFPRLKKAHTRTVFGVCTVLFLCGVILCTNSGFYFFNILNDYSSGFSLGIVLFLEAVLVSYIYGIEDFIADLRSMFGPPKNRWGSIFGRTGLYVKTIWRFLAPVMWIILTAFTLYTQTTNGGISIGKGTRKYVLPDWCTALGWCISVIPLFCLPGFALINFLVFRKQGKPLYELLRVQRKWPSYNRHKRRWVKSKSEEKSTEKSSEPGKSNENSTVSAAENSDPNTLKEHHDPFEEKS
ncbi:unnamed protein product [Bursaphelenchus xylophilus]|uniref:(pine wood nematode) hypothetical protein n=1 Tax=Bursaphelenchus xylophilus TaxID=6326 RepID=A0A1I7S8K7_BURXY|nr:unnamed protein product [Bursaphelenchus xylophilus]CAG9089568.1 unnamed protein product [Bursaphelenchus xylophilus]